MKTEDKVIKHLKEMDYAADSAKAVKFRDKHCEYSNGNATIQCINTVFGTHYK